MATIKQIQFIKTNKYFTLNWVDESVTFEDAKVLCEVISPYSDGNCNYYYRVRTKKEIWFPRMMETIIKIAPKYGISVNEYERMLNEFILKEERKREREARKREREVLKRVQEEKEWLISGGAILNSKDGTRMYDTYLDGELEDKAGFDLVYVSNRGDENLFVPNENTRRERYETDGKTYWWYYIKVYIEDLDEIGYIVFNKTTIRWGIDLPLMGKCNDIIRGLVVSQNDYAKRSFLKALELHNSFPY
jgi:hypothetical protein